MIGLNFLKRSICWFKSLRALKVFDVGLVGYSRAFARIQKLINQLLYSLREIGRRAIVLALRLGLMSITNCDQFELCDVAKLVDDRLSISLYFR